MQTIMMLDTKDIVPGNNDRTVFDPIALQDLAENIKEHGLMQPITVRALDLNTYQIIAGERRYRACKLLGWAEIPAIVADVTEREASAMMLAENTARKDLDLIDEGRAYATRMKMYGWSYMELAQKSGQTEKHIRTRVTLLNLRDDLQQLVRTGNLQVGYAQTLSASGLDTNFQTLAASALRDNPNPNPKWFRSIVSDLTEKQEQVSLFDLPLMGGPTILTQEQLSPIDPPHPSTTTPPAVGNTPKEIVCNQATFWQSAADAWDKAGRPNRRNECAAAAQAILLAVAIL